MKAWRYMIITVLILTFAMLINGCSPKSTTPKGGSYQAGKVKTINLTAEDVDKLLNVVKEVHQKLPDLEKKAREISSKYKGIDILVNFDSFYSEYVDALNVKEMQEIIRSNGMKPDEFWQKMEVLMKCLIVVELEKRLNDEGFLAKKEQLKGLLKDSKVSQKVKDKVQGALDKLDKIQKAVEALKAAVSEESLKVVEEKLPDIKKVMKLSK